MVGCLEALWNVRYSRRHKVLMPVIWAIEKAQDEVFELSPIMYVF